VTDAARVSDQGCGRDAVRTVRGDLVAVGSVVVLVAVSAWVGWRLIGAGHHLFLEFPPLKARWMPHLGPGTPVAVITALGVILHGPGLAQRMAWRPLVWLAWAVAVAWTLGLALIDGWAAGVAGRLTTTYEYLHDVPKVGDITAMLATFSDHILTDQPVFWTTHVGAHPPGVFLLFVWLDRVGLGGGGPAGIVVILVGASAAAAVAVTLRALGAEPTARAVLPFVVLFPGAVWVGVSADGMFTAVLAWAVALLALGATGTGPRADLAAFTGGVLAGYTLYLSYGLVLGIGLVAVPVALTRRWRSGALAVVGVALVAGVFTVAGFWWFIGYHDLRIIYAASAARDRPYSYFVWANLAAFACVTGPAVIAGLRRAATRAPTPRTRTTPRALGIPTASRALLTPAAVRALPAPAAWLVVAAAGAVLVADISGLSKAEVERIWLPFGIWLIVACAQLPSRHHRWWLGAQAMLAVGINSLLFTTW
jgi:hypothetical protein